MRKLTHPLWLCCLVSLWATNSHANNLTITNVALTNINLVAGTMDVTFDIAWENSWRVSTGPANWDAAWVFAKYHTADGIWKQVRISTTGSDHFAPAGSTIQVGTTFGAGVGALLYRAGNGAGNTSWTGVRLRWPFANQGVLTNDLLTVSVLGIEMVYVPQGAFWVGDGSGLTNRWRNGGSASAFQITSEGPITLNNTAGNLWDNVITNAALKGAVIPAAFPKGFQAFYCMKYEISNDQYDRYLYHTGVESPPYSPQPNSPSIYSPSPTRAKACQGRDSTGQVPITSYGRTNAQAATYAYLSWSGLRPMTEFEYEKSCRGPITPVLGEFAWGTGVITDGNYIITNEGLPTEAILSGYSTIAGNAHYRRLESHGNNLVLLTVGIFARSNYSTSIGSASPRVQSGATYWGIMEMTGNVPEPAIVAFKRATSTSQTNGLSFTGSHGNGDLATATGWPAEAIYSRGGGIESAQGVVFEEAKVVSDRTETISNIQIGFGYRGVRTAP